MVTFDPRSTEEIVAILNWGASITISARYQSIENLIFMAKIAKSKDAILTLRDTDTLDQEALLKIAQAGKKNVNLHIRVSEMEPYRS